MKSYPDGQDNGSSRHAGGRMSILQFGWPFEKSLELISVILVSVKLKYRVKSPGSGQRSNIIATLSIGALTVLPLLKCFIIACLAWSAHAIYLKLDTYRTPRK
jgi:hypothetical protein